MTRYLSGLCVAGLGLCGGGWLMAAAEMAGGEARDAGRVNLLTGVVLVLASALGMWCWAVAWRRRLRADGVLADAASGDGLREARRNRRALRQDMRRAARSARLARRAARQEARIARRQAGDLLTAGSEVTVPLGPAPVDLVPAPRTGAADGDENQALLGELRTLLQPLLTAAEGQPWPRLLPTRSAPSEGAAGGATGAGSAAGGGAPACGPPAGCSRHGSWPDRGLPGEGEEVW